MIKGCRGVNSYEIIHRHGLTTGSPRDYLRRSDGGRFYRMLLRAENTYGVPMPSGFPLQHERIIDLHGEWKDNVPDENGG